MRPQSEPATREVGHGRDTRRHVRLVLDVVPAYPDLGFQSMRESLANLPDKRRPVQGSDIVKDRGFIGCGTRWRHGDSLAHLLEPLQDRSHRPCSRHFLRVRHASAWRKNRSAVRRHSFRFFTGAKAGNDGPMPSPQARSASSKKIESCRIDIAHSLFRNGMSERNAGASLGAHAVPVGRASRAAASRLHTVAGVAARHFHGAQRA